MNQARFVVMYFVGWFGVGMSKDRIKDQEEIAKELLQKYDKDVIIYTINNIQKYTHADKVYSIKFLTYFIEQGKKDYDGLMGLSHKIAKGKGRRKEELQEMNKQIIGVNLSLPDVRKSKYKTGEEEESLIEGLFNV